VQLAVAPFHVHADVVGARISALPFLTATGCVMADLGDVRPRMMPVERSRHASAVCHQDEKS